MLKYETGIYNKFTGKSDWICRDCHKSMLKNKMSMQLQKHKTELCHEFESLCPIDLMLTSHIISFMFIVAKAKAA